MNLTKLGCVATTLIFAAITIFAGSAKAQYAAESQYGSTAAKTRTVESVTHEFNPATVYPIERLESWMQPTHVRSRQTIKPNGEIEVVSEPLVQERFERVIAPISTTRTLTESASTGRTAQVTSQSTTQVRNSTTTRLTGYVAARKHHRRHAVASARAASSRRIATRTSSQRRIAMRQISMPAVIERSATVEQRSAIIERRDPALLIY